MAMFGRCWADDLVHRPHASPERAAAALSVSAQQRRILMCVLPVTADWTLAVLDAGGLVMRSDLCTPCRARGYDLSNSGMALRILSLARPARSALRVWLGGAVWTGSVLPMLTTLEVANTGRLLRKVTIASGILRCCHISSWSSVRRIEAVTALLPVIERVGCGTMSRLAGFRGGDDREVMMEVGRGD